jgi:hypothetical protein
MTRKKFEQEISSRGRSTGARDGHGYVDPQTDLLWQIWEDSRKQALEEALQECRDLLALSGRQARDGDHFEIGREGGHTECVAAIQALANLEGEPS